MKSESTNVLLHININTLEHVWKTNEDFIRRIRLEWQTYIFLRQIQRGLVYLAKWSIIIKGLPGMFQKWRNTFYVIKRSDRPDWAGSSLSRGRCEGVTSPPCCYDVRWLLNSLPLSVYNHYSLVSLPTVILYSLSYVVFYFLWKRQYW